jgi:AraC-like DNA-binding protein
VSGTRRGFPAAWLSLECPLADRLLHDAALQSLVSSAQRLPAGRTLVGRVEELLARRGVKLGLPSAARLLGVSPRTLNRRLEQEGTTYLSLVERLRRAQAEALLRDPELTIAEIAHLLGYEDAANFGRAFRRWSGDSPGRYRRHLQGAVQV